MKHILRFSALSIIASQTGVSEGRDTATAPLESLVR